MSVIKDRFYDYTTRTIEGSNFINGKWNYTKSGRTFKSINPADLDDNVGIFPFSDIIDVNLAIDSAKKAFRNWSLTPAPKRGELLFKAAEILTSRKEILAKVITREMGKVLSESMCEVQETIDTLYFAAAEGRRMHGQTTPSELNNKFAMTIRQPLGVCALITPWNFPMAIPSWKIAPALVSGNTVVFKPSSLTSLSAQLFVEVLQEAGMPDGVINLIHGNGYEVGTPLVKHQDVKLISFTGSVEVGRSIAERSATNFKRCALELGGKNVAIIMNDANFEQAMDGVVKGAFATTGQRCTSTSRLLVHKDIYETFRDNLIERVRSLKVGNGAIAGVDLGPLASESQLNRVHKYVLIGQHEGARVLYGGSDCPDVGLGWFYKPTVFDSVSPDMKIFKEEIFGPVVALAVFDNLDEAIKIANNSDYGLSSSLYTSNINHAFTAMRDIESGLVYINSPTIGAEMHLPFGGWKNTGNGYRESGEAMLDIYNEWKTLYVDFSHKL